MTPEQIQQAARELVEKHGVEEVLRAAKWVFVYDSPHSSKTHEIVASLQVGNLQDGLFTAALLAARAQERKEFIDTESIDVGYQVTPGGQKSHVWVKPRDVAAYIVEREEKARAQERERCEKLVFFYWPKNDVDRMSECINAIRNPKEATE